MGPFRYLERPCRGSDDGFLLIDPYFLFNSDLSPSCQVFEIRPYDIQMADEIQCFTVSLK